MIWLNPYVELIEGHLEAGTPARITYAALECRLALERVCYERLRISYDYVSQSDLAYRWTPKQVIQFLEAEANDLVAKGFTLSIGKEPLEDSTGPVGREDFKDVEWLHVGKQVGFDAKALGRHWQALSSFLHTRLPKSKSDEISNYADTRAMEGKIREALEELRRLATGTLIASGLGETVSFVCRCGLTTKRRTKLLKHGDVIACSNPQCRERYRAHVGSDGDYEFERVVIEVACAHCPDVGYFGEHELLDLGLNRVAEHKCAGCGNSNYISWRLMKVAPKTEQNSEPAS